MKCIEKISEFNYKLSHGILNNNLCESKRNKCVSLLFKLRIVNEDMKHLFE